MDRAVGNVCKGAQQEQPLMKSLGLNVGVHCGNAYEGTPTGDEVYARTPLERVRGLVCSNE
jgi:hypothetical protein